MKYDDFIQAKEFICADIQREIKLAYLAKNIESKLVLKSVGINGGGNFLAALGLLSYTDFFGKLKYGLKTKKGHDYSQGNFNAFFNSMGLYYKNFNDGLDQDNKVYKVFRCGLVHEYFIKKSCTIYMCKKQGLHGVGVDENGDFYFVVETYFNDFKKSLRAL